MGQIEDTFTNEGRTIQTIVNTIQQYIQEHWLQVWEQKQEELLRAYHKGGDRAYALYATKLLAPLREQFARSGLSSDPSFPGSFPLSLEKWGPPEERERCFWSILKDDQDQQLGSIIFRFFHDHTRLRLPQMPLVLPLGTTNQDAILQVIEHELAHLPVYEWE